MLISEMPRIFFPNTNKIFAWHDYDNHGWFLIRNRYCLLFVIYTRFLGRVHVVFFIFLVFCVLVFFCFDCLPFVSCAQYCLCPWIMPNIACFPGLCPILPVSLDYPLLIASTGLSNVFSLSVFFNTIFEMHTKL